MVLAGGEINHDQILPWWPESVQPASYDVHLGPTLKRYVHWELDLRRPETLVTVEESIPEEGFLLTPGMLRLGHTLEAVRCGLDAIQISAKSSWMRVGLQAGQGSWADPGFVGNLVLELSPMSNHAVRLYPGQAIAQLVFNKVVGEVKPYQGRYQNQKGALGAKPEAS